MADRRNCMRRPLLLFVLLAACLVGSAQGQRQTGCRADTVAFRGPGDSLTAGSYTLTMVATQGRRAGAEASGSLILRRTTLGDTSPRTGERPVRSPHDEPLVGWSDLDFRSVGAPVFPSDTLAPRPTSQDPVYPGVLVLRQGVRDERFVLLIGTLTNRRADRGWHDGAGIELAPRRFGERTVGTWSEWGIVRGGRGFFCLERKPVGDPDGAI